MTDPTTTTNRIHFEDLEPRRFEELGYHLLLRLYNWKRLDHTGVCGNDGGVDIYGIRVDGTPCFCQVKRYQKLTATDIKAILTTISTNNSISKNAHFILICACDLSKQVLDTAYEEGAKLGFAEIEIFSRTRLEGLLYNGHRTLLKIFFSPKGSGKTLNATLIRKQAKAKQNALKKLIRKDLAKLQLETIAANPGIKFVTDEFMLLSAQSSLAADRYSSDVTYGLAYPRDLLDGGIEFLLPIFRTVFFNEKTNEWREKIDNFQKAEEDEHEILCQVIGFMPFYQMVEIELDGDSVYACPIIHCQEDFLMDSFSKFVCSHYNLGIKFDKDINLTEQDISKIKSHIKINLKK